jgi:hypothetical protein
MAVWLPLYGLCATSNVEVPARLTRVYLQYAIRDFLKIRTSYDVLPLSFRLIILNTDLLVKKSLNILLQNGGRILSFTVSYLLTALRS